MRSLQHQSPHLSKDFLGKPAIFDQSRQNCRELPHKLDFIPILDVHTGFPYSRLDQNWNFVGAENRAGRLSTFFDLDTKFQYPVDFTFRDHRIQFRFGVTFLNVLNHFNPRDVQQNSASPNYGTFYNGVPRLFRIDGDFDF